MTGVSQPSQLATVQRNAQTLHDSGDHPAARQLLAQTIETAQPVYGEDHPEVLAAAHLLARFHQEADDPAAARRVLEEALAAGQRRWGDADPLLLAISFDLGRVAEELGNRHEARRNFTRVAVAGPAVLGADHPTVRAARAYLGDPPPVAGPIEVFEPPAAAPVAATFPAIAAPAPQLARPPIAQPRQAVARQLVEPGPIYPNQRIEAPYPGVEAHRPVDVTPAPASQGRGATIAALVAAAAAVVAAAVVVVVLFTDGTEPKTPPGSDAGTVGPTLAGEPPTDVRLRDDADGTITITWVDPSGGTVPFVVAGGRTGQRLNAMATIDAGQNSYTVHALNPRLDYCFAVLAVYSTDVLVNSEPACTNRGAADPPS